MYEDPTMLDTFVPMMLVLFCLMIAVLFIYACHAEREKRREARLRAEQAVEKAAKTAHQRFTAQPNRKPAKPCKTAEEKAAESTVQTTCPNSVAPAAMPAVPAAAKPAATPVAQEKPAALSTKGNNAFAGQVVAFTGRISGMTHEQAAMDVKANGGTAFAKTMSSKTTLLVVGDKPGESATSKLEKAERWCGQVRKITQAQFKAMLQMQ